MKLQLIIISLAFAVSATAFADTSVRGHFRKDGTYVQPHTRSSPNTVKSDNYGTSSAKPSGGYVSPYGRDTDGDGLSNQFDSDDDYDGVSDNDEK